ncbi:MAG: hypothetical protein ACYS9C_09195 [Planctomycetota bacterium]|jgi:hypothetical protein
MKTSKFIILAMVVLFVLVIVVAILPGLTKLFSPSLKGLDTKPLGPYGPSWSAEWFESVEEYAKKGSEIIDEENPLPSGPPSEKNEVFRYAKVDVVTSTLLSSTSTEPDSILIKNRDEKLNTLISLDPNSEIIPHTMDFIKRHEQRQIDPNQFLISDNTLDDPDGTTRPMP